MIISKRSRSKTLRREIRYFRKDAPGGSFVAFPCAASLKDAVIEEQAQSGDALTECARRVASRWILVQSPEYSSKIVEFEETKIVPAVCQCDVCGHRMKLIAATNTCVCGTDYCLTGQRLAPRSQWGFDTGESVEDILSAGHHVEEMPSAGRNVKKKEVTTKEHKNVAIEILVAALFSSIVAAAISAIAPWLVHRTITFVVLVAASIVGARIGRRLLK